MELKSYYDCSNPVRVMVAGLLVVFLASCSGSQETTEPSIPVDQLPEILRSAQADKDTTKSSQESMKLRYKNKTTDVTIPIDPQKQDFVLELEGVERQGDDGSSDDTAETAEIKAKRDSVYEKRMAKNIKKVMRNFRRAQDLFYREDYKGAMERVNASLEVQETADALGLKGSIFFMRDNLSSAKYYWNKAVEMDPDIPVPDIPALESLIRDIKDGEESQEEAEQ